MKARHKKLIVIEAILCLLVVVVFSALTQLTLDRSVEFRSHFLRLDLGAELKVIPPPRHEDLLAQLDKHAGIILSIKSKVVTCDSGCRYSISLWLQNERNVMVEKMQQAIKQRLKLLRNQTSSYREAENEAELADAISHESHFPKPENSTALVTDAELLEIYDPQLVEKTSLTVLNTVASLNTDDKEVARAARSLVYIFAGRSDQTFMSRDEVRAARKVSRIYRSAEIAQKARAWNALTKRAWAAIALVMFAFMVCVAAARMPHYSISLAGSLLTLWGLIIICLELLLGEGWQYVGTITKIAMLGGGGALLWIGRTSPRLKLLKVGSRSPAVWFALPLVATIFASGWLIQLNIAAPFHLSLRYIALKHFNDLMLALMLASALLVLWPHAGNMLRLILPSLVSPKSLSEKLWTFVKLFAVTLAFIVAALVKSELVLLLAILVFAAFFVQSEPAARQTSSWIFTFRYARWLLFIYLLIMIGAYVAIRDFGPVFVLAFFSAIWLAYLISIPVAVLFLVAMAVAFAVMHTIGSPEHVAERISMMLQPFASTRTDFAVLQWFRDAAPLMGFQLGKIPWCGFVSEDSCPGLPAQLQSDYTFTAMYGLWGVIGSWIISTAFAVLMLMPLKRSSTQSISQAHWRTNYPHSVAVWGGIGLLTQAVVTVLGNLMAFPLTGITFPLLSFGSGSLIMSLAISSAMLTTWEGGSHD